MTEIPPGEGIPSVTKDETTRANTPVEKTVIRIPVAANAIADAAGIAIAQFEIPMGSEWYIERGFVANDGVALMTFAFYIDLIDDLHIRDEVIIPLGGVNRNAFDNSQPIYARGGQTLLAVWTLCTPASNSIITMQVRQET